jgi:hypothetical protein
MKALNQLITPALALALALALTLNCSVVQAQNSPLNVVSKANPTAPKKEPVVTNIGWMDQNRMEQEVTAINELAQTKIGTPIRRDLSDLNTLQRIINEGLIGIKDYESQQALGVVLGNVMLADFPNTFEWKVYEDDLGRSRALCVKSTSECLFPVTMLSRRMEVGSKPDVQKVYNDAIQLMEKYLPKLPYDGGIMYKLPRH